MSATTEIFEKPRFLHLDLLRGIAALTVATGHLCGWNGRSTIDYTMCVAFFFILSGYVLSHAYGEAILAGTINLRDYIVLRLARLYPLHILTAIVMAVLLINQYGSGAITRGGVFETVFLMQSIFTGGWSLNAPSWSIGAEFWAGLIIVPVCSRSLYLCAFALCAAAAAFIVVDLDAGFMASYAERYGTALGCFAIGWFLQRLPELNKPALGWLIALIALVLMMFPPVTALGSPALESAFIAAFSAVIALLAHSELPPGLRPVASFMGNVSYGIYLWHWPLLQLLHPSSSIEISVFFVLLIFVAALGFTFFERPAREYFKAKFLRPSHQLSARSASRF
jgi:peptidoglycan/LPS O-acetylase OafA/YrhL